jgi:hypothetical protein
MSNINNNIVILQTSGTPPETEDQKHPTAKEHKIDSFPHPNCVLQDLALLGEE